ncbi:MAG: hypothetical protein ACI8YQ_003725 [Polaribacter sp.]|jgi:hypothetical protein
MPLRAAASLCPSEVDFDDYDLTSPFTIYVNIHFQQITGEEISHADGVAMANLLLNRGHYYLNSLVQNLNPGPNGVQAALVPTAKYEYKLYTEPSNPNDPHGGIWFHPEQSVDASVYNNRVIDIVFDRALGCGAGFSNTGQDVHIDSYNCIVDNPNFIYSSAKNLNHEMAHSLDLEHVTFCDNQCNNVDISPEDECSPNCPGLAVCDGQFTPLTVPCNPNLCDVPCMSGDDVKICKWNVGNNLTSQSHTNRALTPCQWEVVFSRVASLNTQTYGWADNCTQVAPTFYVPTGTNLIWDNLKLLNRNVVVETGATLTINCEVRMAKDLTITVQRGAKLIVDDGTITNLCPETRWGGIVVHGNASKDQPSDPFGSLASNDAGVVIIINESQIENAGTAIATVSNPAYRSGGLVFCENSTFENNARAVEFRRYDRLNKSKFIDCIFDGGEVGNHGVTIWATDGVTFNECNFRNMKKDAIQVYDAGAIVKDENIFEDNGIGIYAFATHPFSAYLEVGDVNEDPNVFLNNDYHIKSNISNIGAGLKIEYNEFYKAFVAIYLEGPSNFTINDNSFENAHASIYTGYTGALGLNAYNDINNNIISGNFGIYAAGENKQMAFQCNSFISKYEDFRLTGGPGAVQGQIRTWQGSFSKPANNCFTTLQSTDDIVTINSTLHFNYYVKSGSISNPFPKPCDLPNNSGNYSVTPAQDVLCSTVMIAPGPPPTYQKYLDLKQDLNGVSSSSIEYQELMEQKDIIVDALLIGYLENDEVSNAISLLDEENTNQSKQMKFGIYINEKNYQAASNTLNGLSNNIEGMETFKNVQEINLERMEMGASFQMMENDSLYLENIAVSGGSSSGYAQAILSLLFGREFHDDIDTELRNLEGFEEESKERGSKREDFNSGKKSVLVSPNPAKDEFSITMNETPAAILKITSIMGQEIHEQVIGEGVVSLQIATNQWNEGIYLLQLFDKNLKPLHAQLIAVVK